MQELNTILDIILIMGIGYYIHLNRKAKKEIAGVTKIISDTLHSYRDNTFRSIKTALEVIMLYYAEREMYKEAEQVQNAVKELEKLK